MATRTAVLIAAALLAGCASSGERPTQDMTRAQTLIDQAEKAGAQRYAAVQLEQARAKLEQAEAADRKGKHDDARQRAREAVADAELAVAMANSGEAQRAAAEVQQSVETLRTEAHLSQRRAAAVKTALVSRGIRSDRIETVGRGESFPIAGNDTQAGRQQNRRVEIIFSNESGTFAPDGHAAASR